MFFIISKITKQKYSKVAAEFARYCFVPSYPIEEKATKTGKEMADQLFEWAKSHEAFHYSFLCYPHTKSISEKVQTLRSLEMTYDEKGLRQVVGEGIQAKLFQKGQGDGSSFPNGGLRATHAARAYTIWDQKSQVFIRPKTKVVYIPSMLISHEGYALDDKTIFRKAQKILYDQSIILLEKLGVKAKSVFITLGIEQQFFIVPKAAYEKRPDLKWVGRSLFGGAPPKNQQLSDHYYCKMQPKVHQAFIALEKELVEIGIPFQTKHNEVANNQLQFCHMYEEAGKALDHNMIAMQILKQVFSEHGFQVLLHEKPFVNLNGSGKHCNWALNYVNENNQLNNLFHVSSQLLIDKNSNQYIEKKQSIDQKQRIFKLFLLINLKAVMKHSRLYLSSIATPENELRLGGHQAPPRILSVDLGDTISSLIDGEKPAKLKALKDTLFHLNRDINQQDTDRNRTSPYVYTGNKFQFRAVGSSQNPFLPMTVIAATYASQIQQTIKRIQRGQSIDSIIASLTEETKRVRFQGNGYSHQWVEEAKKRGLYVNENYSQNYSSFENSLDIFVKMGICTKEQTVARSNIASDVYIKTIDVECRTILKIIKQQIIPRCYNFNMKAGNLLSNSKHVKSYLTLFQIQFQQLLASIDQLEQSHTKAKSVEDYYNLRKKVHQCSNKINSVLKYLEQDQSLPDAEDFLNL